MMARMSPTDQKAMLVRFMEELIPFNRFLGLKVDTLSEGYCVLRLPWREELTGDPFRPAVHGGVLSTLVDTAGGLACFSKLTSRKDRVSTVDLRVDYLRPGHGQDLLCEARVVRMGNRVAVARMEVFAGALPPDHEAKEAAALATGQAVYNVVRSSES
jgi:uncharacterized protein (TIGR00369 family)